MVRVCPWYSIRKAFMSYFLWKDLPYSLSSSFRKSFYLQRSSVYFLYTDDDVAFHLPVGITLASTVITQRSFFMLVYSHYFLQTRSIAFSTTLRKKTLKNAFWALVHTRKSDLCIVLGVVKRRQVSSRVTYSYGRLQFTYSAGNLATMHSQGGKSTWWRGVYNVTYIIYLCAPRYICYIL